MPDTRKHRGAGPQDAELFGPQQHDALRRAVAEFSWLRTRGYAQDSALKLVGDRYQLTKRQRLAVWRSACSDESLEQRRRKEIQLEDFRGRPLGIDGYNLLITIESALAGGVILLGRDGCFKDLASIHGTYRKVAETTAALAMIIDHLGQHGVASVDWYLDRPVSNSGRLKAMMAEVLEQRNVLGGWNIELVANPDTVLMDYEGVAASTDSLILDRCGCWVNLAGDIITSHIPSVWLLDLRLGLESSRQSVPARRDSRQ